MASITFLCEAAWMSEQLSYSTGHSQPCSNSSSERLTAIQDGGRKIRDGKQNNIQRCLDARTASQTLAQHRDNDEYARAQLWVR